MAFRSELEFYVYCSTSQNNQPTYFTGSRFPKRRAEETAACLEGAARALVQARGFAT